ncbi:hypothetical protein [Cupriavidus sp. TMH.W2]|uniref:hypothetical protein n=1 Tax=Cupriavidus sp. TMH.W2 TaxID=3434465 RepID=UPI003D776707
MAATLITALVLIALVACAAFVIWMLREKNPTLLQQQEQSVRTWFDHTSPLTSGDSLSDSPPLRR